MKPPVWDASSSRHTSSHCFLQNKLRHPLLFAITFVRGPYSTCCVLALVISALIANAPSNNHGPSYPKPSRLAWTLESEQKLAKSKKPTCAAQCGNLMNPFASRLVLLAMFRALVNTLERSHTFVSFVSSCQ